MATILEGLNAISQAVGGAGEAESNLEALNQISEALGGSADAENNADAIANIAENASGGGGSSDFSTAEVTLINTSSVDLAVKGGFTGETFEQTPRDCSSSVAYMGANATSTATAILYKGLAMVEVYFSGAPATIESVSGNATEDDGYIYITGDCTITAKKE